MELPGWNARYLSRNEQFEPTPLVVETASRLVPGRALDLACGTGRNAFWLAEHDWQVTAVDGASAAIDLLRSEAKERRLVIETQVANLERREYAIELEAWDLVIICYYLQRDLFEAAKRGVRIKGTILAIVHTTEAEEEPNQHRMVPGELLTYFDEWTIDHYFEGKPLDSAHKRSVAEVVARRFTEAESISKPTT